MTKIHDLFHFYYFLSIHRQSFFYTYFPDVPVSSSTYNSIMFPSTDLLQSHFQAKTDHHERASELIRRRRTIHSLRRLHISNPERTVLLHTFMNPKQMAFPRDHKEPREHPEGKACWPRASPMASPSRSNATNSPNQDADLCKAL